MKDLVVIDLFERRLLSTLSRYRPRRKGLGELEKGSGDVPGDGNGLLAGQNAGSSGKAVGVYVQAK